MEKQPHILTRIDYCDCLVSWCYLCERVVPRNDLQSDMLSRYFDQTRKVVPTRKLNNSSTAAATPIHLERHNCFWQQSKEHLMRGKKIYDPLVEPKKMDQCPRYFVEIGGLNKAYQLEDDLKVVEKFHAEKTKILLKALVSRIVQKDIHRTWFSEALETYYRQLKGMRDADKAKALGDDRMDEVENMKRLKRVKEKEALEKIEKHVNWVEEYYGLVIKKPF